MKYISNRIALSFAAVLVGLFTLPGLAVPVGEIQRAIREKGAKWVAGETAVSDLPREALCGGKLDPGSPGPRSSATISPNTASGFPSSFDWRNYNGHDWTTPIRNQNPCGSCFIFGPCGAAEADMKVQAGTYGYLAQPDFSEQFVLSCDALSCAGGYAGDTFNFLQNTGAPRETCFPYTAYDTTPCTDHCSDWANWIQKIGSWARAGNTNAPTNDQIKAAIMTYGPCSSWMEVYDDFQTYRGGVYQHVWGGAEDGHFVVLVGWNDSQNCWYVKNSWGPDWGETADMQATSSGATNGGWFRIKYGDSGIGTQVEYAQAGMANLTVNYAAGWTYPLVPRNSNDATNGSCVLPTTLSGGTNTTYWNVAGINNGSQTAPPNEFRFYLDDNWFWYADWSPWGASGASYYTNFGLTRVNGGRHTVGVVMDSNNDVWETNEGDNTWYHQFVWSPDAMVYDFPTEHAAPPKKDGVGATYWNCDGYSFTPSPSGSLRWWSAVGVLPADSTADYDVYLWDIGSYTGSETGFGPGYIKSSSYGPNTADFILVNNNAGLAPVGTYYAGVINYSNSSADYLKEWDTSEPIYSRPGTLWNGPYSKGWSNILDVYECYLYAQTYTFNLHQTAGTCNLGMSLYGPSASFYGRGDYLAFANSGGNGADETFQTTITTAGWYALVVWKSGTGDYSKDATYQIAFGSPAITVTSPNGGETWLAGNVYPITWDNFGSTGSSVNIDLSRDSGSTWTSLASNAANTGSYNWSAAGPVSTTCRIRVTSTSNSSCTDTSDADFAIGSRSITVTSPNGGEAWIVGDVDNISWSSQNVDGNVKIELSRDAGSTWETITASTANTGMYAWTVTSPISSLCRVRVTSVSYPSISDQSNMYFTIASRSLTVTAPNGGETWVVNDLNTIRWSSQYLSGNVMIEVSRDGGTTWSTIAASTGNTGSYPWAVTGPTTSQGRIRVTSVSYPSLSDVSDANFTIGVRTISMMAPVAGDNWYIGQGKSIVWTSQNLTGLVKIELSRDSGASWSTIIASTANTGNYVWTVTGPTSSLCQVRVTSLSYPLVSATGPIFNVVQHRIGGTVSLGEWLTSPAGVPVTFDVRPAGSLVPAETHVVNLGAAGDYNFSVSVYGSYDVAAKGTHWLRQVRPGITINTNVLVNFTLTNGDSDGDNGVTSTDMSIILAAMGATPGDLGWNPQADLNGDGQITGADLSICLTHMDGLGDP